MSRVAELDALQELDSAIDSCQRDLEELADRLGESQELLDARTRVVEATAALESLRQRQRQLGWQVEDLAGRLKTEEGRLYGGAIRNPKELTSLQQEVEHFQMQKSHLEDELLALMMQVEEAEASLAAAHGDLTQVETSWWQEQEELLSQQSKRQQELARLQEQRTRQAAMVDSKALGLYEDLRQRRQGRAVVRVERGLCGGCRIALPTSVLQRARSGFNIVQCTSCERILFMS